MASQPILIVILYFRFPSYERLMAFWNLIEAATAKIVRVTRAKKTYATTTTIESPLTRPTVSLLFSLSHTHTDIPKHEKDGFEQTLINKGVMTPSFHDSIHIDLFYTNMLALSHLAL